MPATENMNTETKDLMKGVLVISLALGLASVVAAALMGSQKAAVSIAVGTAIALASFYLLAMTVIRLSAKRAAMSFLAGAVAIAKLAVLGIVIWLLLSRSIVEPVSFMGGFTAVVVALLIKAVWIFKDRR